MSDDGGRFFAHPLLGAELPVLLRLFAANGPPRPARVPQAAVALGSALLRHPIGRYERWRFARHARRLPPMPPPVFIVGHWRSGTTHLCNVLHAAPRYGCVPPVATGLPGELQVLGRSLGGLLQRGIPRDRLIDRVPVLADSPQEDEFGIANLLPLSFLHGLYFPRRLGEQVARGLFFDGCTRAERLRWRRTVRGYLRRVALSQGDRPLLVRNPVYTARVLELARLFPGCRIIHIHRDPFRLFRSMKNYYRKLLPALAWQRWDEDEVERVLLRSYRRMMDALQEQIPRLPGGCFHELAFEDFEQDPLPQLATLYRRLALPGWDEDRPQFQRYLDAVAGYRKNEYRQDPREAALVREHWGPYVRRWARDPRERASAAAG